jgi:hypothetical protein
LISSSMDKTYFREDHFKGGRSHLDGYTANSKLARFFDEQDTVVCNIHSGSGNSCAW